MIVGLKRVSLLVIIIDNNRKTTWMREALL
jgi:hypothetical protein